MIFIRVGRFGLAEIAEKKNKKKKKSVNNIATASGKHSKSQYQTKKSSI